MLNVVEMLVRLTGAQIENGHRLHEVQFCICLPHFSLKNIIEAVK